MAVVGKAPGELALQDFREREVFEANQAEGGVVNPNLTGGSRWDTGGVLAVHDEDKRRTRSHGDDGAGVEHDGAKVENVRTDKAKDEGGEVRAKDGAAGRKIIGGGAGGRGDDEAIRGDVLKPYIVYGEGEIRSFDGIFLADDEVVDGDITIVVRERCGENDARLDEIGAGDETREPERDFREGDFSEESKSAKVDAEDRKSRLDRVAARGKKGAVAAEREQKVGGV